MASGDFVSYLRVSTDRQGVGGLGIEAQREAVHGYLNGGKWKVVAEYVEVESGRNSDRPALAKALAEARVRRVPLIVANGSPPALETHGAVRLPRIPRISPHQRRVLVPARQAYSHSVSEGSR